MRDYHLQIRPFDLIAIKEIRIDREINQHSHLKLRGYIDQEQERNYLQLGLDYKNTQVIIMAKGENDEKEYLFYGYIQSLSIYREHTFCILEVDGISGSYHMDQQKHLRTFQDGSITYREIQEQLIAAYQHGDFRMLADDDQIGQFLLQYQETDWTFLKRLASRRGSFLVPADRNDGVKYYMGLPRGRQYVLDLPADYRKQVNVQEYQRKAAAGLTDITVMDSLECTFSSREIYRIGDELKIQGQPLYVWKIRSVYQGEEMLHTYSLKPRAGFAETAVYDTDMTGCSLDGVVTEVYQDQVKIAINGDENAGQEVTCWFPYATVYSSPDGAGWYCMPESGDQISLYIPDKDEKHAFVNSAVHVSGSSDRKNPDRKSLKNRYGKEILLTPDSIVLTNNDGIRIAIQDQQGIVFESSHDIMLKADGEIDLTSKDGDITLVAADEVVIRQNQTSLVVDEDISFKGGKINME